MSRPVTSVTPPARWWRPATVCALLVDLIADELPRLRPGAMLPPLSAETALVQSLPLEAEAGGVERNPGACSSAGAEQPAGLALDSLELLDLATAVAVRYGPQEPAGGWADGDAPQPAAGRSVGADVQADFDQRLLGARCLADWVDAVIAARRCDDTRIAFYTSGSTGVPKRCGHAMAALALEVEHWADLLHDRRRVLRAVPCHHIYGFLFGAMLPEHLRVPVLDVRLGLPTGVFAHARSGDLIIGHPGFFALAARGGARAPADVVAVTSTGHCPTAVWERLQAAGIARILEVYGASECGGLGQRWSGTEPFELLPWWNRTGAGGELLQRDDALAPPCEPADHLNWLDARRFRVHARRDGAIQIGGRNVFPDQVRAVLCGHPLVADAAVRPFDTGAGVRLKAFVVPAAGQLAAERLRIELAAWVEARLSPAEQPRSIEFGAELPRTAAGKPADW